MSDENMDNSDEGKFSFSLFVFGYVYKLIYTQANTNSEKENFPSSEFSIFSSDI